MWLNKEIVEDVAEDGGDSTPIWKAVQAHGVVPGQPSADEIAAAFSAYWLDFERPDTISGRVTAIEEQQRVAEEALLEICDMIGGLL